ncbi:MAG: hypothetical protein ABMB14_02215 [Myxococcota bacterium]
MELDRDVDWVPEPAAIEDADGVVVRTAPVFGTTRAGRLTAGTVARLVIGWTGPAPVAITVGALRLAVR